MLNKLERTFPIMPSQCDCSGHLGIPNAFSMFMDIATEHADILGIGLKDLAPQHRFWLTVRSKAQFFRLPALSEKVTLSTWPEHPDARKCNRDYMLRSGDEILIAGKTEWAVIDTSSGRLVRVDTIYPEGLEILDDLSIADGYSVFTNDLSDAVLLGSYKVSSNDIDLGGHMNNVAYIRAFPALFTTKEWSELGIREMEMWYRAQCFENDTFSIYQKDVGEANEVYYVKDDGTVVFQLRYSS